MKILRKNIGLLICIVMLMPFPAYAESVVARPAFGDIDADESITAKDALLILQKSVSGERYQLDPCQSGAAATHEKEPTLYRMDVDGNHSVDAADALLVLQHSVNLIDSFPVEQSGVYNAYFQEDVAQWQANAQAVEINETNFPDETFRQVVKAFDWDENGSLSKDEIATVHEIKMDERSEKAIQNLQGIEYFTELEVLYCSGQALTVLDLSHNTALVSLECSANQLETLDLSKNTQLKILYCSSNRLSSLDISQNIALEQLRCASNRILTLDCSQNTNLIAVDCDENVAVTGWEAPMDIVEINETNFPDDVFRNDVKQFDLDRNGWLSEAEIAKVIEIDVSRYDTWVPEIKPPNRDIIVSLKGIEYFTELKSLLCDNNNIATLDVSNNIKLEKLICSRNQLTELDVQSNSELDHLDCNGNKLTELDLTENINLMKLGCSNNNLIKLNLSKNVQLRHLNCKYNNLTELDLTNNRALVFVWCDDVVTVTGWEAPMDIVEINEANFPDEVFRADVREFDLDCNGWLSEAEIAKVTSINVNASSPVIAVYPLPPTREKIETLKGIEWFTALEYLDCGVNLLTELDISKNLHLKSLTCDDNLLTALDISHNTALISLSCSLNQLTNLDISKNSQLEQLYCPGNQLTKLNISQNLELKYLNCSTNQLTELDVTHNALLTKLTCNRNQLTQLSTDNNFMLDELNCNDNQLTNLNLKSDTRLTNLQCEQNQLSTLNLSQNILLRVVKCSNNNIRELDLTNNTALMKLSCDNSVNVIGFNESEK